MNLHSFLRISSFSVVVLCPENGNFKITSLKEILILSTDTFPHTLEEFTEYVFSLLWR